MDADCGYTKIFSCFFIPSAQISVWLRLISLSRIDVYNLYADKSIQFKRRNHL